MESQDKVGHSWIFGIKAQYGCHGQTSSENPCQFLVQEARNVRDEPRRPPADRLTKLLFVTKDLPMGPAAGLKDGRKERCHISKFYLAAHDLLASFTLILSDLHDKPGLFYDDNSREYYG